MKRTELEKRAGLRVAHEMKHQAARAGGQGAKDAFEIDRRARRAADRAAGRVPLAAKLPAELVTRLRAQAQARGTTPDALLAAVLEDALRDT
jgi:hypothetical protein